MSCNGIPNNLHRNYRAVLCMECFGKEDDLIYRIKPKGNPIEIPEGMSTAVSCMWSQFIRQDEIKYYYDARLGDSAGYNTISEILKFKLTDSNPDEENHFHKLTCKLVHEPDDCNYSHIVVDIFHEIFTSPEEEERIFKEHITYDLWKGKKAVLKKRKGKFYKDFRKQYRADFIEQLFQSEI